MVEKTEHGGLWPSLYDPFRNFATRVADWLNPASEASGSAEAYTINMELPGVSEDDIDLTVENDVVTVRGEKSTQEARSGESWYFSERQYGAFRRSFRLPKDADGARVEAHMKDGVLSVSIPRLGKEDTGAARRVEIRKS